MGARLAGQWDGYKDGHNWHTDKSFTTRPTTATILLCRVIPPVGGDTMFANIYMAYETLSSAMRERLDRPSAVPVRKLSLRPMYQRTGIEIAFATKFNSLSWLTLQPEKQRFTLPFLSIREQTKMLRLLYADTQFVGMSDEESRPLLDFLNSHAVSYEFTYRHSTAQRQLVPTAYRSLRVRYGERRAPLRALYHTGTQSWAWVLFRICRRISESF